jgi:hypothetical protein
MGDGMGKDRRELCVAVTKETDSTRPTSLIQELIEAQDSGERSWRHPGRACNSIVAGVAVVIAKDQASDSPSFSDEVLSESPARR